MDSTLLMMLCAACVCAVVVSVGVAMWMRRSGTEDDWEAEAAKYDPMIMALGDRLEAQITPKTTVGEAMATARRLQPGIKTMLYVPGTQDDAFWESNRGWAVRFDGTSPSDTVTEFVIGYNRVMIGYSLA